MHRFPARTTILKARCVCDWIITTPPAYSAAGQMVNYNGWTSCLNNFFISLQKIIDYERDHRLKREREEQERRDAAERQRIHEENLRVEKAKVKRLKTELEGWETSHRIRTYLTAMRGNGDLTPDQTEWLAWADTYANHLDPTNEFRIEVLDDA